jgi:hypothetical protein
MEATEQTALVEFNVTDAAIQTMKQEFMGLQIIGVDDKEGFEVVHNSRMIVKNKRIEVEKTRKALNENALSWQRKVNSEAKRITELLAPIEEHLQEQEATYEAEREKVRKEIERKEQERMQGRVALLMNIGMSFNGAFYFFPGSPLNIDVITVTGNSDEKFTQFLAQAQVESDRIKAEADRKAKEEVDRLEAERLKKEAIEKAKAEEQQRIRIEQERIALVLKDEREKIEAEKKRIAKENAETAKALQDIILEQQREEERLKVERAALAKEKAEREIQIRKEAENLAVRIRRMEAKQTVLKDEPGQVTSIPQEAIFEQPKAVIEPKITMHKTSPAPRILMQVIHSCDCCPYLDKTGDQYCNNIGEYLEIDIAATVDERCPLPSEKIKVMIDSIGGANCSNLERSQDLSDALCYGNEFVEVQIRGFDLGDH